MMSIVPGCLSYQRHVHVQVPKIKLQDLQTILQNWESDHLKALDHLQDIGRKMGIIEVSNLGLEYSNALKTLHKNAPNCIGSDKHRLPRQISLPDGSYRKTYATTTKTYLDCLDIVAQK